MQGSRRGWLAALVCVGLVAGACSGGGGGGSSDDPLAEAGNNGQFSVSIPATGGVRLGGTFAVPPGAKGPVPGVVILPTIGPVDRNGIQNPTVPDPVYEDLSKAFLQAGMATLRYDRRGIGASRVQGKSRAEYDGNEDLQIVLAYLIQTIGEAASRVSVELRGQHPESVSQPERRPTAATT